MFNLHHLMVLIFEHPTEVSDEDLTPTIIPRRPLVPTVPHTKNGHANPTQIRTTQLKTGLGVGLSTTGRTTTTTSHAHNIIQAAHPQDNEIAGSVNIRYGSMQKSISFQFL